MASSSFTDWLAGRLGAAPRAVPPAFAAATRHVIGYATGYTAEQVAPFVLSLRAHFDGAITLIVDDAPELAAFLKAHDVIGLTPEPVEGWAPHVVVSRLAEFARLLDGARPDAVALLTDVRDVVFQGDPLSPRPERIEAFDEQDGQRFRDHAFNRKHTRLVAGREMTGLLEPREALCIGTVVGPAPDLARLCRVMLMICTRPRSETGAAFGADQAAFNLAVHLKLVDAEVRPNFSRVATTGVPEAERMTLRDGQLINPDGSISPILHQYDRRPEWAAAVGARWGVEPVVREHPRVGRVQALLRRHLASIRKRIPELR